MCDVFGFGWGEGRLTRGLSLFMRGAVLWCVCVCVCLFGGCCVVLCCVVLCCVYVFFGVGVLVVIHNNNDNNNKKNKKQKTNKQKSERKENPRTTQSNNNNKNNLCGVDSEREGRDCFLGLDWGFEGNLNVVSGFGSGVGVVFLPARGDERVLGRICGIELL